MRPGIGGRTPTYTYDTADRLTSKATPAGTLNYTYDAAGNVASIVSSNTHGASMSYTWDSLNRLSSVVDNLLPAGANTTTYTYDAASNLGTVIYPNGIQSAVSYDAVNRPTGMTTVTASFAPTAGYSYTLNNTGIPTEAAEALATSNSPDTRTLNWTYDKTYRLASEQIANDSVGNNGTVNYTLDPVGNRTQEVSTIAGLPSVSLSLSADDLLTSSEAYDANGNTSSTGSRTFAYDSQNHLVSMNGGAVTLVYDGDGNRVSKTASGVTTQYLVDDLNPTGYSQVIEELVGGAVQREYTYGLQRISENQSVGGVWIASFYGYDGGGTVRQLTNSAGAVTDTYNYDAFGNKLNSTGSTPNNYLYRGELYDSDLALYYLRARYYNPITGRFMSRDPYAGQILDPKTLHKYLYTDGSPVAYVDPRGKDLFEYAIQANAAIPEARLISIYQCIGDAGLAAVDLTLYKYDPSDTAGNVSTALGTGSTIIGCVVLTPGIGELAETGGKIAKRSLKAIQFIGKQAGWGACALDAKKFVKGLDSLLVGDADAGAIGEALESLGGCVGDLLADMLTEEAKE